MKYCYQDAVRDFIENVKNIVIHVPYPHVCCFCDSLWEPLFIQSFMALLNLMLPFSLYRLHLSPSSLPFVSVCMSHRRPLSHFQLDFYLFVRSTQSLITIGLFTAYSMLSLVYTCLLRTISQTGFLNNNIGKRMTLSSTFITNYILKTLHVIYRPHTQHVCARVHAWVHVRVIYRYKKAKGGLFVGRKKTHWKGEGTKRKGDRQCIRTTFSDTHGS